MASLDVQSTMKNIAPSPVSALFFSPKNFEAVQHGIRYRVWVETNREHVISDQSDVELGTIMRGIYLEYGRDSKRDVVQQVKELNAHVLDYAVPKIVSELQSRTHYLYDITHQPVPLDLGATTSTKGERQLEMKPFF